MFRHGRHGKRPLRLESEIAHAVTMCEGPYVTLPDFKEGGLRSQIQKDSDGHTAAGVPTSIELDSAIEELVRHRILLAMESNRNMVAPAARMLGVSRGRFYDLAKKYGIKLSQQ